jgi:hypothetical protein
MGLKRADFLSRSSRPIPSRQHQHSTILLLVFVKLYYNEYALVFPIEGGRGGWSGLDRLNQSQTTSPREVGARESGESTGIFQNDSDTIV